MNITPLSWCEKDKNGEMVMVESPYDEVWTSEDGFMDICLNLNKYDEWLRLNKTYWDYSI